MSSSTDKGESGNSAEVLFVLGGLILGCLLISWMLAKFLARKVIPRYQSVPARAMIILGSGGHTKELLEFVSDLHPSMIAPRIYVYSKNDELSVSKALGMENELGWTGSHFVSIRRARVVGQGWISTCFTTLLATVDAIFLVIKWKPNMILCNGPGVCVPICIVAKLASAVGYLRVKIIFIESVCRVSTLSLTGRILRPFADGFIVQWRALAKKYPGTTYLRQFAD